MTAKITLYSEDETISKIKKFAKEKNTSVSKLVNGFFQTLLADENSKEVANSNITNKLFGSLKEISIDAKEYKKYLEEKYL